MKRLFAILAFAMIGVIGASASDGWTIEASGMEEPYFGIFVGNGGIGILPWNKPFSVNLVVLNHVFDEYKPHDVSTALRGVNPFKVTMCIDDVAVDSSAVKDFRQVLDMRHAVHTTAFTVPGKAEVRYDFRALRHLAFTGMTVIEVKALSDIHLTLGSEIVFPKGYADITVTKNMKQVEHDKNLFNNAYAESRYRKVKVSATSAFLTDNKDATCISVDIKEGDTFRTALAGSVCTETDFLDPFNESDREVILVRHQGLDATVAYHEQLWDELWQGDIEIEGDDDAQRTVRLALYSLYSSCRKGSRMSIPPTGLSNRGYNEHVFWDAELWMYPPMLFLNSDIAESMMNYRIDRLPAARKKAMTYGYSGAMFPWESDFRGDEACPTFALTGLIEQHITADVAIAAWNYFRMTGNLDWLKNEGWGLLKECAEFWCSRVRDNNDGTYSIVDVVGADEYAQGVTDNAFTNGSAICALRSAVKAAKALGYKAPAKWTRIADGIRILKDPETGITLEYEGYNGQKIKQGDANLLAYPLQLITDSRQIKKDLAYYEAVMDHKGPAMSFSILALQHSRLGDGVKAYELFQRAYCPNRLEPFGAFSESPKSDNAYFTTGAGGILQTVINGFGGLELTDKGIVEVPSALPPHWKKLTIKGVGPDKKTYVKYQKTADAENNRNK